MIAWPKIRWHFSHRPQPPIGSHLVSICYILVFQMEFDVTCGQLHDCDSKSSSVWKRLQSAALRSRHHIIFYDHLITSQCICMCVCWTRRHQRRQLLRASFRCIEKERCRKKIRNVMLQLTCLRKFLYLYVFRIVFFSFFLLIRYQFNDNSQNDTNEFNNNIDMYLNESSHWRFREHSNDIIVMS